MPNKQIQMRIYILLLVSAVISSVTAQQNFDYVFVVDSLLEVRSAPNDTSRIICSLKNGDKVQLLENTYLEVELDEGYTTWYKISFDTITGYSLHSNLSGPAVQYNNVDTFDIIIHNYGLLNYNPNLNWYAVFSTDQGDCLKKVNLNPVLELHAEDHHVIVPFKCDSSNLLFLIGTKSELDTSIIGVKSYLPEIWLKPTTQFDLILYNKVNGFSNGHKLTPEWKYLKSKISEIDSFTNYRLSYFNKLLDKQVQLYNPQINWFNQIPKLVWYGDIDHDQLPEFLFFTNGDNRGYDLEFMKVAYLNGVMVVIKLVSKRPGWPSCC